jgi:hypothetical protein
MPEGSGWRCTTVPKHGSLDEVADRLARADFMSLRPFGPTLSASLGASEKTAWPCGRRRTIAVTPLAQERGAVLDNYFHDLRVEPDSRGRRGLEQDRRIASPLTGLRSRPCHASRHAFPLPIPTAVLLGAPNIVVIA